MKTAGLLFGTLSELLHLLRHRYRTGEGADWISDTLEEIEDATSPADLREALSEVLVGYRPGVMKPPRIDELVVGSLRTLHSASAEDAVDVGGLCVAVRDACGRMMDPYDAQAKILARLPTGVYVLAPCAYTIEHQAISEVSEASPATSTKVTRSPAGRVRSRQLPTGQTCTPLA